MKIFYFLIFIVSISFSQNEIKHSDIIGEWEIKIKVKQLLKEEIKELDIDHLQLSSNLLVLLYFRAEEIALCKENEGIAGTSIGK